MAELLAAQEDDSDVETDRRPPMVAAGATLLSLVLVSVQLGEKSFWHDEGFSVGLVDRPFGDALWRMAHWEVNQSPFFLLLAGWWRLGHSESFLRLLPAVFAVLAVPALYDLGRRLVGARAAAVAALLLALHPLVLEWGQQIRGYSLTLLLTIVATTLLLRALEAPESTGRALAYAFVAALATYSHFFAGLVIATHALWMLVQRPVPRRLIIVAGIVYAALVAPLVEFLLTRDGDPLQWVGQAGTRSAIVDTAKGLTGGSGWNVVAYTVAAVAGLWAVAVAPRGRTMGFRQPAALPVMWLVLPVAAVTASTVAVKPLLEARFLIVVVPALVLLAATGICRLPPAAGVALLALLVVVSALGLGRWYATPTNEDWRTATVLVARASGGTGSVVVFPFGGSFAFQYYEERLGVDVPMLVSPPTDGSLVGPLVEVRSRRAAGDEVPVPPAYEAWRDRNYALQDESFARGIAVRTYVQD